MPTIKAVENENPEKEVICPFCGQKFLTTNPENFPLPKHKNPFNGKDPDKVGFCVGEGKKGILNRIKPKLAVMQNQT
ncbi:MAG: hypothetical protein NTX00_01145 [Candidatus Parcubacteria bacterium]|nr:hypothetical protein [Candidatus Parcubacteria bacterium]